MSRNVRTGRPSDGQPAERLLTPQETGELLGIAPQTLAHWRCKGRGPAYRLLSARCVRYEAGAIEQWLKDRGRTSTAENAEP